jgi:hypothetical protein
MPSQVRIPSHASPRLSYLSILGAASNWIVIWNCVRRNSGRMPAEAGFLISIRSSSQRTRSLRSAKPWTAHPSKTTVDRVIVWMTPADLLIGAVRRDASNRARTEVGVRLGPRSTYVPAFKASIAMLRTIADAGSARSASRPASSRDRVGHVLTCNVMGRCGMGVGFQAARW